ncbi:MAG: hypothetical protein CMH56_12490 [Myxococcales bacterium]|nr:hypothetical protein [Myxococcales bacterium]|tara:strand:+ start:6662 stop:7468 length:807 start_codon:yes stop_codon:yes gene_type:complete
MNQACLAIYFLFFACACASSSSKPDVTRLNDDQVQCAEGHQLRGEGPPVDNEQWCRDEKGVNQGPWVLWHANGKVAARGNFRGGLFQGALQIYDASGQLSQEYKMLNGKMHGAFTIHWPHGPMSLMGEFFRNQKKGPFIYYDFVGNERKRVGSPSTDPEENNEPDKEGDIDLVRLKASLQAANVSFEQCYETILRQDRTIRGEAQLVFWIDTQGFVDKIRYEDRKIDSLPLLFCIENALSRTRFPKAQIAPVTIAIPLRFNPSANFDS